MIDDEFQARLDQLDNILGPLQDATPGNGTCQVCDRPYRLTKTGKIWTHNNAIRDRQSGSYGMRCSGSGKLPKGRGYRTLTEIREHL